MTQNNGRSVLLVFKDVYFALCRVTLLYGILYVALAVYLGMTHDGNIPVWLYYMLLPIMLFAAVMVGLPGRFRMAVGLGISRHHLYFGGMLGIVTASLTAAVFDLVLNQVVQLFVKLPGNYHLLYGTFPYFQGLPIQRLPVYGSTLDFIGYLLFSPFLMALLYCLACAVGAAFASVYCRLRAYGRVATIVGETVGAIAAFLFAAMLIGNYFSGYLYTDMELIWLIILPFPLLISWFSLRNCPVAKRQ